LVGENEMLREEIRHLQLELEVVKMAKMEACTLCVLSRDAEVVGKSKDETEFGDEEYMCKECGDLYTGAGY
jgi:transposase-like protein